MCLVNHGSDTVWPLTPANHAPQKLPRGGELVLGDRFFEGRQLCLTFRGDRSLAAERERE